MKKEVSTEPSVASCLDQKDFTPAVQTNIEIDKTYTEHSFFKDAVHRFKKNKGAVFGLIMIVIVISCAIFAPILSDMDYRHQDLSHKNMPPRVEALEFIPLFSGTQYGENVYEERGLNDVYHPFGTDTLGRDLFVRAWTGARVSLYVALLAIIIDTFVGLTYGLVSGYFGGLVDTVMQRFVEILFTIPQMIIVTLLIIVLKPGLTSITLALIITEWLNMSRVARAQTLRLKEMEFVLASKTLGASHFRVITKDILPNIFGQVIIMCMFTIPTAIFTEAFLAFIGLGVPAPLASLGSLISDGFKSMTMYPYLVAFPVIILALLMLSFNLVADGLRDALDPKDEGGVIVSEQVMAVRDLSISFQTISGTVRAVRSVDLDLHKGETLAIVGESGSGKSVTVKAMMGIASNNQTIDSGSILYRYEENGTSVEKDILSFFRKDMRQHINGTRIAMVFQDPMTSLDPTMTIGKQLMEGMIHHLHYTKAQAWERAIELLNMVDIKDPEKRMRNHPHQLSGGMRQRVVIAIALSCNPEILICDEPTTALDVTIQAKILEMIKDIQTRLGITVVYITHDLGVVAKIADYVCVMYAGKIVERGTVNDVFYNPKHPYTWGLLSSMPDISADHDRLYTIPGTPPNLLGLVHGDPFAPRNVYALEADLKEEPPLFRISDTHYAATWLLDERAPKVEMPESLRLRIENMVKEAECVERETFISRR